MKFIDEAKIRVRAGDGGKGCISFRREKYVPRGGPNGGDGGDGGSVFFVGSKDKTTLLDFQYAPLFSAKNGEHGKGKDMHGRSGESLELQIPLGTIVSEIESGEILADITYANQKVLIAKGGQGGKGNHFFVSPTNRAPRKSQPGEKGEERFLKLELKLIADVALIGKPNAGKSTFLATVTAARPKIANYPFTTLVPQLGVVKGHQGKSFTLADIPGLLEGASRGVGMGIQFLKHIERTKIFLHFIDQATPPLEEIWETFESIEKEILAFGPTMRDKPRWVLLTKVDAVSDPKKLDEAYAIFLEKGFKVYKISSLTGQGVASLIKDLTHFLFHKPGL